MTRDVTGVRWYVRVPSRHFPSVALRSWRSTMNASRAELAARYEAGESFAQLADSLKVSERTARNLLRGVATMRAAGPRPGMTRSGVPAAEPLNGRSWEQAVTARLIEVRALQPHWTFDLAWRQSIRDYPTPARQQALPGDALFDEWGDAQVTLAAFFEAACRDAWHGDRPALRHFSSALLLGADDGFTSPDAVIA